MSSLCSPRGSGRAGIVLLGEMHGTVEMPALAARVMHAAAARSSVILCLEIPDELQLAIDAFVTTADRAALLSTPHMFWDWQDARSSEAMLASACRVRLPALAQPRRCGRDVLGDPRRARATGNHAAARQSVT